MAATKLSRFRGIGPILRICMFTIAAITTVLSGVGLRLSIQDELYADGLGPVVYIFAFSSAAYTFLWCGSAMLVLLLKGPYHPGIDIGFDIVGWGLAWGMGLTTIIYTAELNYTDFPCDPYYGDEYQDECSLAQKSNGVAYSIAVLMLIYGSAHLALFILACNNTHKRRITKKRESFVELEDVGVAKG